VLFLVFELDARRYAIEAERIAEVLPLVTIDEIARAPVEVAGVFLYRGAPVPVVDLTRVLAGRGAARRLSTRIVVVRATDAAGESRLLGLLAEKATDTIRREPGEFVDSGVRADDAACLGPVANDARGMVQRLDIAKLVAAQQHALFRLPEPECPSPNSKNC
jgi:chemotaxis-related protein WspB